MADEIGLNDAQIEAIRRGYTVLESVCGYYIRLDNGVKYEKTGSYELNDYINLDPKDFWTIEQAAVETVSEDGVSVTLFYEADEDYDFHEVTMDEFEQSEVPVGDECVLSNSMIGGDDRDGLSKPSNMKDGLASTWDSHGLVVGIEDVVAGYGVKETTGTVMSENAKHMGPIDDGGMFDEFGVYEVKDIPEWDASDLLVTENDVEHTTEEHLFEAWKEVEDQSLKAKIADSLHVLGYTIEPTGYDLVPMGEK